MIGSRQIATGLGVGLSIAAIASPASAAICDVNPQGVSFGNYDPLSATALDGVGNINVTCNEVVPFSVSFDQGQGSYAERRLIAGADWLGYNLYINASRAVVWGDGVTGSTVDATGNNVDLPVYGRIPAQQNIPAGVYLGSITVTVTY